MQIPVIFEDDSLVVINKPSRMVVNRAQSVKEETVQDWAEKKYQSSKIKDQKDEDDFYNRAGIVHRLDKETSGLLIIAKNPIAFAHLQSQFKERQVKKKYLALAHGMLTPREGEISASVGRLPWNRERFGVLPGGRPSVTGYKVISYFQNQYDKYSLLEVAPHTGRTHQIRIHLKYLGFPVVSDEFYAGRKRARKDREFCSRLFLHAAKISLLHPVSGKLLELTCDLPDDLEAVLNSLNKF